MLYCNYFEKITKLFSLNISRLLLKTRFQVKVIRIQFWGISAKSDLSEAEERRANYTKPHYSPTHICI